MKKLKIPLNQDSKLVWIDLEMTGLNAQEHSILEIGVVITNTKLDIIKELPSLYINCSEQDRDQAPQEVIKMHQSNGLWEKCIKSHTKIETADQIVSHFLSREINGMVPLCGNSVWKDREFIVRYMPKTAAFFKRG